MNVRGDAGRVVKRAPAHKPHAGAAVLAEDRDLAAWATEDPLRAAMVSRYVDRSRLAGEDLDTLGLDQEVDDERAAGLTLTVQAMAAMNEERVRREPVTNASARAPSFHGSAPYRPLAGGWLGLLR